MNDLPGLAEERLQSYLDDLLLTVRGRPREVRRLLIEVESHLRDSIQAGCAAGMDPVDAADQAMRRFGPPSSVVRGLPRSAAYRTMFSQLVEACLLVVSTLLLAVGVAAVPTAVVGLTADPDLVTGDRPGLPSCPARGCGPALTVQHLEEVVRNHLLVGVLGFVVLAAWWVVHVHRESRPRALPTGFSLTVCGSLLCAVGLAVLVLGVREVTSGATSVDGLIGSGDLVATGATVLAAALACWLGLARLVTRTGWRAIDELTS